MIHETELTFNPEALWGTFEKISSAKERVSLEADNPNSTSFPTTSAGDEACLAAKKTTFSHIQLLIIVQYLM